ncbi:MAG: hypothetical protein V3U45_05915 [bacterium]
MTRGETDDAALSDAMAEFNLMAELPQLTPTLLDAMDGERVALLVARAEYEQEVRKRVAERMRTDAAFAGLR